MKVLKSRTLVSWGGPLCPDRRTIVTSGRPRGSWGSGPGRNPDNPILEAGPKPLDFLYTPSMRLATLGSGACPGSFGLSQDRLRRGVRGTSATRRVACVGNSQGRFSDASSIRTIALWTRLVGVVSSEGRHSFHALNCTSMRLKSRTLVSWGGSLCPNRRTTFMFWPR